MCDETHMNHCVSVQVEQGSTDLSTDVVVCRSFHPPSEACSPGRDRGDVRCETGHQLQSPAHRGGLTPSVCSAVPQMCFYTSRGRVELCSVICSINSSGFF